MATQSNCESPSLFTCHQLDDLTVLSLSSDLRACSYASRQQQYNQLMKQIGEADSIHLVFNLEDCGMLDSVTVGILVGMAIAAIRKGGTADLCGVSPETRNILVKLMLLEPQNRQLAWQIYDDVSHVLAGIATASHS